MEDKRLDEVVLAIKMVKGILNDFKVTLQVQCHENRWILCVTDEITGKCYGLLEKEEGEEDAQKSGTRTC